MTNSTPTETIRQMESVLSDTDAIDKVKAWARRKLQSARTEQLKQECAPKIKLSSDRRA